MAGKAVTKSQADKPKRSSTTAKKRSTTAKPKAEATATALDDVTTSQTSFAEQYGTHG